MEFSPDCSLNLELPDQTHQGECHLDYFACLAQSLDGKIAPQKSSAFVRLGSIEDIEHLKRVRDLADALVMGGKTLRAFPKLHSGQTKGNHTGLWLPHVVFTRTRQWNWQEPWAQGAEQYGVPVVFCSPEPPDGWNRHRWCHWVPVPMVEDPYTKASAQGLLQPVDRYLRETFGISRILIEGGGDIVGLYLMAQWLKKIYITLCPLILGGPEAPSLASAVPGWSRQQAPTLEDVQWDQKGNELYLQGTLVYPTEAEG